jgi:crossover junction endodeoxyribonuclease RuvC
VRRVREQAPRFAVIEKAQAMPKQGVASTFKYGVAYGALCAVTALLEIPAHLVSPRKWKSHFNLDSDKEKSRALAIRLWPGCGLFERKKDHGRAESALLARYGAEVLERVNR